jgi:CubicO group peptidase (beta-lactamase class C family)
MSDGVSAVGSADYGPFGRPSLDTWLAPGRTRWSLRHTREVVPTERIRRGASESPLQSTLRPELLDLVVLAWEGPATVRDLLARERDSLVVLHGDDVVLEWLDDGICADEPHLVFSVTKSVTGLLAGSLAGAGLLDLGARVVDYVPEVAGSAFGDATLRHLLDMEASFSFVEDYTPGEDIVAYRHAVGWYPAPADAPSLMAFLASRRPDGPHGERFRYLSPGTDLMGWVLARASGLTWAQALSRYVWAPMGAEADAEVTVDREGTPRAAGGLCVVPRDLARLGRLVARGGDGVVPAWFVDDLMHAGNPETWARGDFAESHPGGRYRSYWYAFDVDPDVVCGIGIHGQLLYVDVPRQVVVVIQSSWAEPDPETGHFDNQAIARTLAHALA